ncbi:MAG: co-chaperone GroES [Candidatus Uhrbacteria bacterium]|nr:co-chaperone GroES [Candidatus Uhrbacteria bacterium]
MNLKPVSDHLVLKSLDAETVRASGIIIPDTVNKERPEKGEVLAVGPGKMLENGTRQQVEIRVGDKVLFKKYAPDEVEVDGEKYLIISADDVMAVIE